jgi:hypothetical protein
MLAINTMFMLGKEVCEKDIWLFIFIFLYFSRYFGNGGKVSID